MSNNSSKFEDGKYLTRKAKELLVIPVFLLIVLFIATGGMPLSVIGWQKTPGAMFEKRFYHGKYKVIVSDNQSSTKEYKLIAVIDRHIHCDPGDECGSLAYWVSTIYALNGEQTEFDDDTCAIGLQHESTCKDRSGNSYSILMTSVAVE